MNNHLVEIDGKYPWGISPFSFGMLALIWALFCLIWWLMPVYQVTVVYLVAFCLL